MNAFAGLVEVGCGYRTGADAELSDCAVFPGADGLKERALGALD